MILIFGDTVFFFFLGLITGFEKVEGLFFSSFLNGFKRGLTRLLKFRIIDSRKRGVAFNLSYFYTSSNLLTS